MPAEDDHYQAEGFRGADRGLVLSLPVPEPAGVADLVERLAAFPVPPASVMLGASK
jgi:hypothetical protein